MFLNKYLGKILVAIFFAIFLACHSDLVFAESYTASISTPSDININISTVGTAEIVAKDIVVNSTCPSGYTVSISGPNDPTLYLGGDNTNNSKIEASSGTVAAPASLVGSNLGTWGYSVSSSEATGSFIGVNSTIAPLFTKSSASATGGDTIPVYFGASATNTQAAGTYTMAESGALSFYLVNDMSCIRYTVAYDGNGADAGITMSATHEDVKINDEINLYAANFKRAGYGFAGWSTVQLDPNATNAKANLANAVLGGKVFGPNETITAGQDFIDQKDDNNTIHLYAVWVKSEGNIQDWDSCNALNTGEVTALTDTRDNQVYSIAKLADGNCWMIENLRLDNQYTTSSTDIAKAEGYNSSFIGLADPETANFANSTIANSLYSTANITGTNQGNRFPRYNNQSTNSPASNMTSVTETYVYSQGNYYTWAAAVADTAYYNTNNQTITGTSICPAGWHLPSGGDDTNAANSEVRKLSVAVIGAEPNYVFSTDRSRYSNEDGSTMGTTASRAMRSYPNNLIFSGSFNNNSPAERGTAGLYRSSSIHDGGRAYSYYLSTHGFTPSTNSASKTNGYSVRCVADKVAQLDTGQTVNQKLKRLVGNSSATHSTEDNNITALVRSNTLPSGFTPTTENTISTTNSGKPIYAWYDSTNKTIYYYSEATTIKMNQNSSYFFHNMNALSDLSTISSWDTSSVTTMSSMFDSAGYSATTWSIGDLSSWDTSSVTNMSYMFYSAGYNATTFTLNLSSWDTSSVTNMSHMFYEAGYNATTFTLNLSSWNTAKVTNMSNMFYKAGYSATTFTLNLSSWNTSKVTHMSSMFRYAGYSATTFILDLSSWDTSSVTTMYRMFYEAGYSATTFILDLSSWDTSKVTDMSYMFYSAGYSATTWSISDLSSWNTSSVTDMSYMFRDAGFNATTFTLDLSSWDTSSVTDMSSMFQAAGYSATTWSVGNLSSWNTSKVTNMTVMFYSAGYSATTFTLDLSSWNTASVTSMSSMFQAAGYNATTWSVTIPKTNKGSTPITNTTTSLYGNTTSVYAAPLSGKTFTLAN